MVVLAASSCRCGPFLGDFLGRGGLAALQTRGQRREQTVSSELALRAGLVLNKTCFSLKRVNLGVCWGLRGWGLFVVDCFDKIDLLHMKSSLGQEDYDPLKS